MARRPFPWKAVLLVGVVVLLAVLIGGYQLAMRQLIHAYYENNYAPEAVDAKDLTQAPPAHRLADVPWLSEDLGVCQSVSLRMLAAQQGRLAPRSHVDFFMGFTWGATAIPRKTGFFPGQDPEPGFRTAAPYLGFTRRYLVTDSQDDFVRALKSQLARGRAVRVALDRASLLEQRGISPHSVVLVGYDEQGFEYYEPVCDDAKRCAPGEKPPGAAGLTVDTERFLMAVEAHALAFQYPWTYQLTVLEPLEGAPPDPAALLEAHGRALIGLKGPGPSTGSVAVRETAKALERHGDGVLSPELLAGVTVAAVVRRDDALALGALFPERPWLASAAEALDRAALHYGKAAHALETKSLEAAVQALLAAAAADQDAGAVLLAPRPDAG